MLITGTVSSVQTLEKKDDKEPLSSVSIEGVSFLCPPDNVPVVNAFITANVRVQWRKGARPLHWLDSWKTPTIG